MYLRQRNQQRQSRSQHAGPVSTHEMHRPRPVAAQARGGGGKARGGRRRQQTPKSQQTRCGRGESHLTAGRLLR
jgi:hypothetical protein